MCWFVFCMFFTFYISLLCLCLLYLSLYNLITLCVFRLFVLLMFVIEFLCPFTKYSCYMFQGCESSDFNLISDFFFFCSSQNPIFRLLMHWKAHLFRHFRLFQTFFRFFLTDALTPLGGISWNLSSLTICHSLTSTVTFLILIGYEALSLTVAMVIVSEWQIVSDDKFHEMPPWCCYLFTTPHVRNWIINVPF